MKDDRVYLRHILDAVGKILDFTRGGREAFIADPMIQDAVIRNIEVIGEAAKSLSSAVKDANPDIPWTQIASMRNTLIHRYFRVDLDLVWQVVEQDLPGFKIQLEAILNELPSPPEGS
jgi:uncharacterized protein with HEPN domain